jgi:hypothetical protein
MVTLARTGLLELGALLAAIYAFALAAAIRGAPPAIEIGIAIDLTVTAAAATWWLGVKRGRLSRRAPLVVLGAGALTVRLALPAAAEVGVAIAIAAELGLLAVIAARAPRLVRGLRRDAHRPAILRIGDGLEEIGIPRRLARILTTEATTLGLALTGWFRRAPRGGFTVHRTHTTLAFHAVFAGLVVLEAAAFHILLAQVTPVGAWIATATSLYALLWLLGDAHALRLGRIRVEPGELVIEIARRWAVVIPRHAITAVRRATEVAEGVVDLAIETPTVELELAAPVTARGPFGIERTGARLALTVDDAAGFMAALGWPG